MTAINADGLHIRFAKEEGVANKGGQISTMGATQMSEIDIDYTEMLTATASVLGTTTGPLGLSLPQGARIEAVETVVLTAFTSSGTIGSATVVLGTKDLDRSTEEDHDGLLTTSATGTVLGLATAGTVTKITKGSTGAGALIGTSLGDASYVCVANSAHASHPFTAGKLRVRIYWTVV